MAKTFIKHVYQLQSDAFIKGVIWETYVCGCLQHEADQNQLFHNFSNCLEGVLNDLSQFSLFLARFSKTPSETCLWRLFL